MHEFYKSHNFAIHSEEGREEMILELHDISNALNLAHMHLSTISKLFEKLDKRTLMSIEDISKLIRDGKRIHFWKGAFFAIRLFIAQLIVECPKRKKYAQRLSMLRLRNLKFVISW